MWGGLVRGCRTSGSNKAGLHHSQILIEPGFETVLLGRRVAQYM